MNFEVVYFTQSLFMSKAGEGASRVLGAAAMHVQQQPVAVNEEATERGIR